MAELTRARCAYCGTDQGPFEAEHPVPRCLWERNRPNRMVTVPACGQCNDAYTNDEEYFRTVLVALAGQGRHPEVDRLLDGKVQRALTRNERLRAELTRGFCRRPQFTDSGLFVGWGWAFQVDFARINRVVAKTVRGLFYHKSQRPLAAGVTVRVLHGNEFRGDEGFQRLLTGMTDWEGVGDDVFQCRCAMGSDPDVTVWLFVYYQTIEVFAWTENEGTTDGQGVTGV